MTDAGDSANSSKRPIFVRFPSALLVLGLLLLYVSQAKPFRLLIEIYALLGAVADLLVLAFLAVVLIERPLRTESIYEIRDTANRVIQETQQQTIGRLLRGWLPLEHYRLLEKTTLVPFLREDVQYRIQILTGQFEAHPIPDGYVVEIMDHSYRVRNISDETKDLRLEFAMSKEGAGILPGLPDMRVGAEYQDGTPVFQPYAGPGVDKGDYLLFETSVSLAPNESIRVEIYTRELRLFNDSEVIICPMPAYGVLIDFDAPNQFDVSASALHPDPGALRRTARPSGQGFRFSLPSPILPGTSVVIKWRVR